MLPRRPLLLLLLLLCGCAGLDSRVVEHLPRIDPDRIMTHVAELTHPGPRFVGDADATERTITYLRGQLESYGYKTFEEKFNLTSFTVRNLFAMRRGTTRPEEVIEVSAHYDTVSLSPGADDNTSAVAGLLEIARAIADTPLERSVRFCLFGGEEVGLVGSQLHVQSLEHYPGKVIGLINLEMIGYTSSEPDSQESPVRIPFIVWPPRTGDFILVVGNFSSGGIGNRFEAAADRYVPELRYYSVNRIGGFFADAGRSDHFSYWNAGIPAIMLTDTGEFRNPHYHQPTDVPGTLDPTFMANVMKATVATLLEWARLPDRDSDSEATAREPGS